MIIYYGIFVRKEDVSGLMKNKLDKVIENPHITFEFKPTTVPYELFGKEMEMIIDAYGVNSSNEGVRVKILNIDGKMKELYEKIKTPHITLSISKDGKAVDTAKLDFTPIKPIKIKGVFGGYSSDGSLTFKNERGNNL